MATPSIGDILMLSQIAWRIGCSFTAGKADAPAQFQEIENELKNLTTATTMLAETIDKDGGLLSQSDEKTKEGLEKILDCCRQTLDNLESFVNQYQVIRRPDETEGLATQRSWKQVLLKNYRAIIWTTEGGSIDSLRNMLAMHTQSITLAMQALQSRSLSRLEHIIEPVAEQMDNVHNEFNGDLDIKIDEMRHVMLSLKEGMDSTSSNLRASAAGSVASPAVSPHLAARKTSVNPILTSVEEAKSSQSYGGFNSLRTPQKTPELSDGELSAHSPNTKYITGKEIISTSDRRDSTLIPLQYQYRMSDAPPQYEKDRHRSDISALSDNSTWSNPRRTDYDLECIQPERPPSDLVHTSPVMLPPLAIIPDCDPSNLLSGYEFAPRPKPQESSHDSMSITTLKEQEHFEQALFTDATILCEVRGTSVDFTVPDDLVPGEWRMEQACSACKICLVTKNQRLTNGAMRFMTSVWTISDDRSVRLQQKIKDGEEIIPYTVWGNEAKVVLRVPTELRFHDTTIDGNPLRVAQTAWVNYVFELERSATIFQNALIGKTLLLSVKTKRTMRIHNGIAGTFAFAEQLCGLENLRIFQDPQTGGVLALLHYSPVIQDGYMAFYLNSSRDAVRVRDDSDTTVRIKGLNISIDGKTDFQRRNSIADPSKSPKPKPEKIVKAIRVEFSTAMDKQLFKDKFREIQGYFFPGER